MAASMRLLVAFAMVFSSTGVRSSGSETSSQQGEAAPAPAAPKAGEDSRAAGATASSKPAGAPGEPTTYRVRLLLIRHGFSCANVMDSCTQRPEKATEAVTKEWDKLNDALRSGHPKAKLKKDYGQEGIEPSKGRDCTVRVEDPDRELVEGLAKNGDVIRLHDLYSDPLLTDCSLFGSTRAGTALLNYLVSHQVRVRGVYSSMLVRAMETAYAMLLSDHHSHRRKIATLTPGALRRGVVPVPFMLEMNLRSSVSLDNTPLEPRIQEKLLRDRYGDGFSLNPPFQAWAGETFNWAKFKAFFAMVMLPHMVPQVGPLPEPLPEGVEDLRHLMQRWEPGTRLEWGGGKRTYTEGGTFTPEEWRAAAGGEDIVVLLAGHSAVMSEVCQMGIPNNNEVYERRFLVTRHADGALHLSEQEGSCHQILSGPQIQSEFRKIAHMLDVHSCNNPFDVSEFLDLDDAANATETVRGQVRTKCMRMAVGEDIYHGNDRYFFD